MEQRIQLMEASASHADSHFWVDADPTNLKKVTVHRMETCGESRLVAGDHLPLLTRWNRKYVPCRECKPSPPSGWKIKVLGTQNVCQMVTLEHSISCTCMDQNRRKAFCKHIQQILQVVLKLEVDWFVDQDNKRILDDGEFDEANVRLSGKFEVNGERITAADVRAVKTDDCSICQTAFNDDAVALCRNSCKNVFHEECVDVWLRHNTKCPLCRQPFVKAKFTFEDN